MVGSSGREFAGGIVGGRFGVYRGCIGVESAGRLDDSCTPIARPGEMEESQDKYSREYEEYPIATGTKHGGMFLGRADEKENKTERPKRLKRLRTRTPSDHETPPSNLREDPHWLEIWRTNNQISSRWTRWYFWEGILRASPSKILSFYAHETLTWPKSTKATKARVHDRHSQAQGLHGCPKPRLHGPSLVDMPCRLPGYLGLMGLPNRRWPMGCGASEAAPAPKGLGQLLAD